MKLEFQIFDLNAGKVITKVREIDEQQVFEHNAFAKMLKRKAEKCSRPASSTNSKTD